MTRSLPIVLGPIAQLFLSCRGISLRAVRTDDAVAEEEDNTDCLDAVPGDNCHELVTYTLENGLKTHPDMFPAFNRSNSDALNFKLIQDILHSRSNAGCGRPCWPAEQLQERRQVLVDMRSLRRVDLAARVDLDSQRWPWSRRPEATPAEAPAAAAEEAKPQSSQSGTPEQATPAEAPAAAVEEAKPQSSQSGTPEQAPAALENSQAPPAAPAEDCVDAAPGDACHELVTWTLEKGVKMNPQMYPGFNWLDSDEVNFKKVQDILHSSNKAGCGKPCLTKTSDPLAEAKPAEAPAAAAGEVDFEKEMRNSAEAKPAEAPAAAAKEADFEKEMGDFAEAKPEAKPAEAPAAAAGEADFEKEMGDAAGAKPGALSRKERAVAAHKAARRREWGIEHELGDLAEAAPAAPAAEEAKPEAKLAEAPAAAAKEDDFEKEMGDAAEAKPEAAPAAAKEDDFEKELGDLAEAKPEAAPAAAKEDDYEKQMGDIAEAKPEAAPAVPAAEEAKPEARDDPSNHPTDGGDGSTDGSKETPPSQARDDPSNHPTDGGDGSTDGSKEKPPSTDASKDAAEAAPESEEGRRAKVAVRVQELEASIKSMPKDDEFKDIRESMEKKLAALRDQQKQMQMRSPSQARDDPSNHPTDGGDGSTDGSKEKPPSTDASKEADFERLLAEAFGEEVAQEAAAAAEREAAAADKSPAHLRPAAAAERAKPEAPWGAKTCYDAVPGDSCHGLVIWALNKGIKEHPDWFPTYNASYSYELNFKNVQASLRHKHKGNCSRPCAMPLSTEETLRRARRRGCLDAAPGDRCHQLVAWSLEVGIVEHPGLFSGFVRSGSDEADFSKMQDLMHNRSKGGCWKSCLALDLADSEVPLEPEGFEELDQPDAGAEPAAAKAQGGPAADPSLGEQSPGGEPAAAKPAAKEARSSLMAPPRGAEVDPDSLVDAEELPTGELGVYVGDRPAKRLRGDSAGREHFAGARAAEAAANEQEELPNGQPMDVEEATAASERLERERLERTAQEQLEKERLKMEKERLARERSEQEEEAARRQPWWKKLRRGPREASAEAAPAAPFGQTEPGSGWRAPAPEPAAAAAPAAPEAVLAAAAPEAAPAAPEPEAAPAAAAREAEEECQDAAPGDRCHELVQWSLDRAAEQGSDYDPEWFPTYDRSKSAELNFKAIQGTLHSRGAAGCRKPCPLPDEKAQPAILARGIMEAQEEEEEEEENSAGGSSSEDAEPTTTLEPLAAKSLPDMSPSDLMDYLNNQEELNKYAYYLTHTSRRQKAEDRKRLAEKKKREAAGDANLETSEEHVDAAPQEQ